VNFPSHHASVRPSADHTVPSEPVTDIAESRLGRDFSRMRVHTNVQMGQVIFRATQEEKKQTPRISSPKLSIYQAHWLSGEYFKGLANQTAQTIKALALDPAVAECPANPQYGPTPYKTGADIVTAITQAYKCTSTPVKEIHIFSHAGSSGVYDTSGQIFTTQGMYGENPLFRLERDKGGRLVSDIPTEALSEDVVFVMHGCDTASGDNSFAEALYKAILGTSPKGKVYGHTFGGAAERREDWREFSAKHPEGRKRTKIPYY
jgi:hypothetical protein